MYRMKADGVVFYDPSADDMALHVLAPKAKFELNKSASLTFTMLPGNVLYNKLHKMKTIVTLEQDDEVIFRGRVLETATDTYNQMEVYCESELSYLLDSLVRPYDFEGKASDLFRQLVTAHNEQVDDYKRFEVGIITAVTDEDEVETESESYADTLAEIRQMLIYKFNGYLRIRVEDGVRYLDYIDEYDDACGQAVEFGVNLVDIENKIDAVDVFSVLVPLGDYNTKNKDDPITIESVNDGKDYLEDAEAIAKYGRIVKTYKWEEITDPKELLEKGQEHIAKMKAARTLTIKAVDLHIVDASVDSIRLGKKVRLLSTPHGLDEPEICSKIDLDIEKPGQTVYTFGLPPESMTDKNASRNRKNDNNYNDIHRWLSVTNNSFDVFVDSVDSRISLKADLILLDGYVKASEFETDVLTVLNGANIDSMSVNTLVAGDGDFDSLWCGQLNGGTAATQEWVKSRGYLTSIPTGTLDGFVTAQDVANYCEPLYATKTELSEYVKASSLEKKSQYVVTEVSRTMNSAGYVIGVSYTGTTISYYG